MVSEKDKKAAFKESLGDTLLATVINFPINFGLISFVYYMEFTAFQSTCFITAVLFTIAVARKYFVRLYFHERYLTKQQKKI